MARYWIIVASKDHVARGVAEGFAQACHGKAAPLRRMHAGDGVAYYSSKLRFGSAEPCQCFTAIGEVQDEAIKQVELSADFAPFRRTIRFMACSDAPIRLLIPALSFISDKRHWGGVFRYGMCEIPATDFALIAAAMGTPEAVATLD